MPPKSSIASSPGKFDPRNILVIDFGQLGDVVLSLPALRSIRKRFASATITVAVGKSGATVVRMSRYADAVLEVDRVQLRDGSKFLSVARILKLVSRVRKSKFDFVIDLHSLSETNLLGFFSGAPHRLYARRPGRSLDFLANFNPRPPAEANSSHLIDRYLDVLQPLGLTNQSRVPVLQTDPTTDQMIDNLLEKARADSKALLVGLFPGAGHESRRWPMRRFAELADYLIRNDNVRVVLFAGPEELALLADMRKMFPPGTIFMDRLSVPQLASAQARLTLFVSNDTGPMHVAAAVGTSVIVLLGRPTPHIFVPVGEQHRVIFSNDINEIEVEQVYKVAHELLATSRTEKLFSYSEQH
ncbi:MAG: glycosyltransferase family 9 protein [Pyrinomonadaceae bacterium]